MQLSAAGQNNESKEGNVEFFVPDLCAPRPVFLMILLAQLLVMVYTVAVSDLPQLNWELLARASLFVQWIVLLSALLVCLLRGVFSRLSLPLATSGVLLLVILVTGLSSALVIEYLSVLSAQRPDNWWLLQNVIISVVITGVLLRYFYLQQQLRLQEKLELQARIQSLQARIRPHFLFNTLNSIASLIATRPDAAETAVEDLSELFRASLKEGDSPTTVADEIRLCKLYLGIEQLRLGDRLSVDWQVDNSLLAEPMPSLVLQPLVENAVYHGIARIPGGGSVSIAITRESGQLVTRIENPVLTAQAQEGGHHMALPNVEQRLQALYGSRASVKVEPDQQRFRVTLSYPPGAAL